MAVRTISDTATDQARQVTGTATQEAGDVVAQATGAAAEVTTAAREHAGAVAGHAAEQGRQLADEAQERMSAEAELQTSSLATNVRGLAAELRRMASAGTDGSPLQALLSGVAGKGESLATMLDEQGPDGLMREAQEFGRRRPGAFLVSALAAGFATTRLAKHAGKAADSVDSGAGSGAGRRAADPYPSGGRGRSAR